MSMEYTRKPIPLFPGKQLGLRFWGILILTACICIFFNLFFSLEGEQPLWKIVVSNLYFVALSSELSRLVVVLLHRRFPEIAQNRVRIPLIIGILLLLAFPVGASHLRLEKDLLFQVYSNTSVFDYLSVSGSTFFFMIIISGIYESALYFREWSRVHLDNERLAVTQLETQLELLKNQVQPHFLFNSLNTLDMLVEEDPPRARKFIGQLSMVYRYLLQSNEKSLISLEEELAFVRSYFFLLQTRFEEGLQLEVEVGEKDRTRLIPPLTLQLLLENAVKHNQVDKDHPLRIRIACDEHGELSVVNSLRLKTGNVLSGKLGLANINAKLRLLGQPGLEIIQTEKEFIVRIKLV